MKETIFLVDDNVFDLKVAEKGLQEHYNIITFSSGEAMLCSLSTVIPDLILLDITMPGLDGFEVIDLVKENPKCVDVPVIFLTGINDNKVEHTGFEKGAVDFVTKPYALLTLVNRIRIHTSVAKRHKAEAEQMQRNLLKILSGVVESRDNTTGAHTNRTTKYVAALMGGMRKHGVYADEMKDWNLPVVALSAALHDVGKINVSDTILNKPAKLTEAEYDAMKEHALIGTGIINDAMDVVKDDKYLEDARLFAEFHHENWDGTGYPHGLKGTEIPLQGRIMAVADVYDALVSERPYKSASTCNDAVTIIMSEAGKKFDPNIIAVFYSLKDEFQRIHNGD